MPQTVRNTKESEKTHRVSNTLKNWLNRFLNIVYPEICLVCDAPLADYDKKELLCSNCWTKIKKNTPPLCAICGRPIRGAQVYKKVCFNCQRQTFAFDRAFSPCVYEGVIRELIHRFKYHNKEHLSRLLAGLLIEFIYQYRIMSNLFDLVMPIPLHRTKLREREFNQADLLAAKIAMEFSVPLSQSNLWCKSHRQPQMELKQEQRWQNVKGCFAVHNPEELKAKNILLVDDVLTTGATCSEAANVLKQSGAHSVFVLTLAN